MHACINLIWVVLNYSMQSSIIYFYYYLLLLLILSHTLIPCIHNFSHSSCSPLLFFPCAQVSCSFNFLPCVCHVHLYRSICQNILALGDKIALCGVWWKDSGVYWYSFCFFFHYQWKGFASNLGSERELAAGFLQLLLQFLVLDIQGGHCLPYFPDVEIWQRGVLQCLPRGWLVCNQLILELIIRYR